MSPPYTLPHCLPTFAGRLALLLGCWAASCPALAQAQANGHAEPPTAKAAGSDPILAALLRTEIVVARQRLEGTAKHYLQGKASLDRMLQAVDLMTQAEVAYARHCKDHALEIKAYRDAAYRSLLITANAYWAMEVDAPIDDFIQSSGHLARAKRQLYQVSPGDFIGPRLKMEKTGVVQRPAKQQDEEGLSIAVDADAIIDDIRTYERDFEPFLFDPTAPFDGFDGRDYATLGKHWYQNGKTGLGQNPDLLEQRGTMRRAAHKGQLPARAAREAAILSFPVPLPDMLVSLKVEQGGTAAPFGVLLRADDPAGPPGPAFQPSDQIASNRFYYAVVSGAEVVFGRMAKGQATPLARAKVEPRPRFLLAVRAQADEFTVYRDGKEILRATDNALHGRWAGIISLQPAREPIVFDDFSAMPIAE